MLILLKTIGWFLLFKVWEIFFVFPALVVKNIFLIFVGIVKFLYDFWIVTLIYSISFYFILGWFSTIPTDSHISVIIFLTMLCSCIPTIILCAIIHISLQELVSGYCDLDDVGYVIRKFIQNNWEKAKRKAENK